MTDLSVEVSQPLAEARVFRVVTQEQYSGAGEKLKAIKGLMQKVNATFDPIISKAYAAHKEAIAQKKNHEGPLIEAEGIYKRGMLGFQQEQERIRREEQARLDELARKERERLEARAAKAEEKGKAEKAEELRNQAATVPAPVVQIETPKVAGTSIRTTYYAYVKDFPALLDAAAGGRRFKTTKYEGQERRRGKSVPVSAVISNESFLNAQAKLQKTALNYPGVEAHSELSMSIRAS